VIGDLDTPRLVPPVHEGDHVLGHATAPVTLVEYGDYECPFCGAAQASVQEVLRSGGDSIRFAFRHFPLSEVHPHARLAAEAAEAAAAQGRFWQMHEVLFANQQALMPTDLLTYAAAIGLDMGQFAADLEGHRYASVVREHFLSGLRSGVNGTPTFFVNGFRHNGAYDAESLLNAVARESAPA
jgi:Na+:H+ antiporter, NhaA family